MNIKHIIGALALFIASPAFAGSGCYIGGHVGMSATKTETSADASPPLAPVAINVLNINGLGSSGTLAGLHAGCDVQLQQFVIGAFGDYDWHNEKMEISSGLLPGVLAAVDVNSKWTVGGRAGILFEKTLVYGLFGYSRMSTSDINVPAAALTLAMPTFEGWVLGGGIETEIAKNIKLGVEYRRARYDRQDIGIVPGLSLGVQPEMHTATARLSYVFDFAAK